MKAVVMKQTGDVGVLGALERFTHIVGVTIFGGPEFGFTGADGLDKIIAEPAGGGEGVGIVPVFVAREKGVLKEI